MAALALHERPFYLALLSRLSASLVPQRDKPEETPEATLRALWSVAAGRALSARKTMGAPVEELDGEGAARLAALVERRLSGIPLAHLTRRQHFMGLEFLAGEGALIPRMETEILGRAALAAARALADVRGSITALDICTGGGNIAMTIAVHEPRATVIASDLVPEAVELARANAKHLGVEGRVISEKETCSARFIPRRFSAGSTS